MIYISSTYVVKIHVGLIVTVVYFVLKDIVMRTIMLQSYLITDDNRKLLCQEEVFDALVVMLHDAIHGKAYYGYIYPVISVIKVG